MGGYPGGKGGAPDGKGGYPSGKGEGSTMSSAAADVLAVLRSVGPVDAVLGHSLGGKIAMALVRDHLYGAGACAAVREGGHVWVLDSQPRAQAPGAGAHDPRSMKVNRGMGLIKGPFRKTPPGGAYT